MKYQITCDNCGTQFLIEAEGGQTVECRCPKCRGLMQITLPDVSKGEHYQPSQQPRVPHYNASGAPSHDESYAASRSNEKTWLWIAICVLVVVIVCVIGFAMHKTAAPLPEDSQPITVDTIPYEQPVINQPQEQVDTIVEQPQVEEPEEEEPLEDESFPSDEEVDPTTPTPEQVDPNASAQPSTAPQSPSAAASSTPAQPSATSPSTSSTHPTGSGNGHTGSSSNRLGSSSSRSGSTNSHTNMPNP